MSGALLARRYRPLLIAQSLELIKNIPKSDILNADSAGYYRLPENIAPKLLLLIGMPSEHKQIGQRFQTAGKQNIQQCRINKRLKNGAYIAILSLAYGIFQLRQNAAIIKLVSNPKPFPSFRVAKKIVFMIGQYDPYPVEPELKRLVRDRPDICWLSLPGSHRDI